VGTTLASPLARHHRFRALGTYVHLATTADLDRAVTLAEAVLAEVDRTCSRFRADSDLSLANARAGRWTEVDPLLSAAVGVALDAAQETGGLVDPCLGVALAEIGYDDDLAVVLARRDRRAVPPAAPRPGAWREVGVDPRGAVFVPDGVRLDLGATAKAWAADLLAVTLVDTLGGDALVSLGGAVRIAGDGLRPWPVVVTEHPDGTDDELDPEEVTLDSGGLATSSTTVRRWTSGGVVRHHLLDPATGRPVTPYWRTVTATGPTCVAANVATTAAVVLGAAAEQWLTERAVDARLVSTTGEVRRVGRWPDPALATTQEA
jgi:thiamine biosynthesis lipoprotein